MARVCWVMMSDMIVVMSVCDVCEESRMNGSVWIDEFVESEHKLVKRAWGQ